MTFEEVRALAHRLPGVEDGSSYGTAALKVKGKRLVRLKEDGETLVLNVPFERKELLMEAAPDVFFQTPHYEGYPLVLVRLATVDPAELAALIEAAWRERAPRKLVAAHDARKDVGNTRSAPA